MAFRRLSILRRNFGDLFASTEQELRGKKHYYELEHGSRCLKELIISWSLRALFVVVVAADALMFVVFLYGVLQGEQQKAAGWLSRCTQGAGVCHTLLRGSCTRAVLLHRLEDVNWVLIASCW